MNLDSFKYLTTDSRAIFDPASTVFAAIRTEVADGHKYIAGVLARGTAAVIAEYIPAGCEKYASKIVLVENVAATLAEMARRRLVGVAGGIAITGSVGKTTVKELIYTVLRAAGIPAVRSPRSWNSAIGLPLAVWQMTTIGAKTSVPSPVIITEAGIDGPGQGRILGDILGRSHHIGVITPLTDEHDEAFESHADKVREKLDILAGCSKIFCTADDYEVIRSAGVTAKAVNQGAHPSIYHALAAAVLDELSVVADVDDIPLVDKRRYITAGARGNTIIRDRFTPDLVSLADALDFAVRHSADRRRKVLVLGGLMAGESYAEAAAQAHHYGFDAAMTAAEALCEAGRWCRTQVLIFGAETPQLVAFAEEIESAGHDTTLEVDLDALIYNYNYYRHLLPPDTGIVAMVKASAYGLGPIEIGKALQSHGAAYLAVAVIDEGLVLRDAGITMPVMVLNPVTNRYPALFAGTLEPAVFSFDELDRLIAEAKKAGVKDYPIHIKLDTGMHRVGFVAEALPELITRLKATDAVRVRSVFSHLATADCLDMDEYTRGQLAVFAADVAVLQEGLGYDFMRHILNTAGMMRFAADAAGCEMARLGIGLYGISPLTGDNPLHTVATFGSRIISLKHWPKDTPIGYGCNGHTAADDSIIATVPVGYADGVDRRLGNGRVQFMVRGVPCPTIGNICMDLCMVDVTAVPGVAVGDSVEIFGRSIPVERIARALGTIPYEVLTSVAGRVKRIYVKK